MEWVAPGLSSGLGNRLFQHAAAAGLAERLGRPLRFITNRCSESPHGPIATIFRMYPSVPLIDTSENYTEFKEAPRGYYMYIPLPSVAGPIVVQGFRQSPKYFPTKGLEPDWDSALGGPLVRAMIERDANIVGDRTVSIHMRLGDYRNLAHHQIPLGSYFQRALKRVPKGYRLHLFSDEPNLCAQQFAVYAAQNNLEFSVAKPRSDVESLYEMSLCRGGNIVGNSTFSWWGAWFAHSKGSPWATYPSQWGQGMPETTDLFPDWGIVIEV
jgi:hypothetical protein